MEYCGEVVPIEVAARRLEAYEGAGQAMLLLYMYGSAATLK